MGFFRGLGKGLGEVAGTVVGGPVKFVGETTGIKTVENIGEGVQKASTFAGDTLGQVTDGAVNTASGIWHDDQGKINGGLSDMGDATSRTAKGVYHTAQGAYHNGKDVVGGAMDGDTERLKHGASGIVTTVAVGALAVGVVDAVDGADGGDTADSGQNTSEPSHTNSYQTETSSNTASPDPGTHHVDAHHVEGYTRADGTVVSDYWRDGDGDPNTQLTNEQGGGYERSNPDGDPST